MAVFYMNTVKPEGKDADALSETKFKLKVPQEPSNDLPIDDLNTSEFNNDDLDGNTSGKPFDDEPFDAGTDTSEDENPKKFIEQLSGKIGQSLRAYTDKQGQPDLELEKFAINSLLSATHTSEMDKEDKNDIISKVESAGEGDSESDNSDDINLDNNDEMALDNESEEEFDENIIIDEVEWDDTNDDTVENSNPTLYPEGWKELDTMFMNGDLTKNTREDLSKTEKNPIFGQNKEKEEDMLLDEIVNSMFDEPTENPTETPVKTPVKTPEPNEPEPTRRVDKPWRTPGIENDPDPKAKV